MFQKSLNFVADFQKRISKSMVGLVPKLSMFAQMPVRYDLIV